MSRIFITGSSTGLGLLAAQRLIADGHDVVLHARNEHRARDTRTAAPGAQSVIVGDLQSLHDVKRIADDVNALGRFDSIIHNAGVYNVSGDVILAVNTIAPYVLTCLIDRPARLVYLGSGDHRNGRPHIDRIRAGSVSYADSKLHDLMFAKAIAHKWPDVCANAVDPGWVPTRMGGKHAPDDLDEGIETQVWLATSDDARANVSGRYFYHMREARYNRAADDVAGQEDLITACAEVSGVRL